MTQPMAYGVPVLAQLDPMPTAPVAYPQMLRTPRATRGRGVLMIVCLVLSYVLVSTVLQGAAVGIDLLRGSTTLPDLLAGKLTLSPALLLAVNLTNAACIPLSMLLQRAFFGQRGHWLHSVTGRFRWRVLAWGTLIVLPVWALYLAFMLATAPETVKVPSGSYVALLVIVVLTTPLQAAGEEYATRGLITHGAGCWFVSPRTALLVGTLMSGTVFTLAHGAGDPWLIGFYFVFAVLQSLITWRTGGLELAVLLHTANNLVAFGSLVLLQLDTSTVLDRGAGSAGPGALVPVGAMLLSTGALWLWAARSKVQRAYVPGSAGPDGKPIGGGSAPPALDPESTYVGPWAQTGS